MTVDYDGEQAAPEPISTVIAKFLRRSFSVSEIFKRATRGWLFGLIGMGLGFLFGIYSIWTTPPTYSVSIGLLPTEGGGGDAMIGDSGGALTALAGLVGIGGGSVPKFTRFVASLYASGVAKMMDQKYDMVCRTFRDCDLETHKWRKHTGFDAWLGNLTARIAHLPPPDSPRTAQNLASYTTNNVLITSDKVTHVLTLTMESRDPKFAVLYLQTLVKATNDFIKNEDRGTITPYLDYITQKLTTNLNVATHDALSNLLLEQERRMMLTSVDVPYAASVQDGPNVASSNSAQRMLTVDTMLGLVLGLGVGIYWNVWIVRRRGRSQSWTRH